MILLCGFFSHWHWCTPSDITVLLRNWETGKLFSSYRSHLLCSLPKARSCIFQTVSLRGKLIWEQIVLTLCSFCSPREQNWGYVPCVPHWGMKLELKDTIIHKWDFLNYYCCCCYFYCHLCEVIKQNWTEMNRQKTSLRVPRIAHLGVSVRCLGRMTFWYQFFSGQGRVENF